MIFCTLADSNYLPGVLALLQSLKDSGDIDDQPFRLFYRDEKFIEARERIEAIGRSVELIDVRDLGRVEVTTGQSAPRFAAAFDKLLLFKQPVDPQDEKVCYIDCDMLCLGSLRPLLEAEHFSAAPDIGMTAERVLDHERKQIIFNSGLMVFRPAEQLFAEMIAFMKTSGHAFTDGDQHLLNYFFYRPGAADQVHILHHRFNSLKRLAHHLPERFDLADTRLLHFVGRKPWQPDIVHHADERPYMQLYKMWHDVYLRATAAGTLRKS